MVQEKNEHHSKNLPPAAASPAKRTVKRTVKRPGKRPVKRPVKCTVKRTAARHSALRQKLLDAATKHMETNGLAELRARHLAQAAGCSVGAIYNVFADLDAIILAVNAATLEQIGARMAAIKSPSPPQTFGALAAAYLGYAVENRRRWDALFTHRLPSGTPAPAWFMQIQSAAFSPIEAPLRTLRPDLSPATVPLLARSIFAAVHGIVALGLEHRTGPIDLPALTAQLTTIATAIAFGLAAPPPNR